MSNSITVFYPGKESAAIHLNYAIELIGKRQTINCSIVNEGISQPVWLQVKKFSIPSLKEGRGFLPVFEQANNNTNVDTSLFIDFVYRKIMGLEKMVIFEG